MSDDTLALLDRAFTQMSALVEAIRPEQLSNPTPCAQWDLGQLLRHLVRSDLGNFAAVARNEAPDWGAEPSELGDNWLQDYRDGAASVLDAWRSSDNGGGVAHPENKPVGMDQQIAELAVHAWDIARATGRSTDLDPELAERALTWSQDKLKPEYRGPAKAFGDEVSVSPDAPIYDRMAAWFGRDPS